MKPSSTQQRREKSIRRAVIAVYRGQTFRDAAIAHDLPKTTVYRAFYAPMTPRVPQHHRRALSNGEEKDIVNFLCRYSDLGVPLSMHHVTEAVQLMVRGMCPSRRITLPFVDGNPGPKFFRNFMKRHKDQLKFVRPLKQEHDRFKAVNAETLTAHFCTIEKLIRKHNLDSTRIWNLDECGVTPGKDANGRSQRKRILRRNGNGDIRIMRFHYDKRITFMPVISTAGEAGPCLFVFKGKRMPYRRVIRDGTEVVDSLSNHLPRRGVVTMREEGGGVDKTNFLRWAEHFVRSVKDLTRDGRKVLLIYDAYRSHMSIQVLRVFAEGGVVVYALPAHTSGKTQPLDVVAFSTFKRELNALLCENNERFLETGCTLYDLCDILCAAYNHTFTLSIIQSSFSRSDVWPFQSMKLMKVPRPADSRLSAVLTIEEMEELMNKKREELGDALFGNKVTLLESGFIDTTNGAVLTTYEAMKAVQDHDTACQRVKAVKKVEQSRKAIMAAKREEKARSEALHMRQAATKRQVFMAKMTVEDFKKRMRSIAERRAHARLRTAKKAALRFNM